MANGLQKPTSETQLCPKKDVQSYKPIGKLEHCSPRQKVMPAQRTDNHSSVEAKGDNKENKENTGKSKSKDAK